jgi:FkbM family methyltransferase
MSSSQSPDRLRDRIITSLVCLRNGCRMRTEGETFLICRGSRQIRLARKHMVYAIDLAHHFETYFSQVKPQLIGKRFEADYSGPRLHQLSSGLEFEISSLPEEAETLDSYFRFFRPLPGDTVFDIGAYCGVFTRELSLIVGPSGRVIAFEPDALNASLLQRNIERHNLSNVTVVRAAVSESGGTAAFNSEGALGSALASALDRGSAGDPAIVETVSLEDACRRYGVPSFIKIDAEGAEIEIIRGAQAFLSQHRVQFAIDTNHTRDQALTAGPVEALFEQCGYKAESSKAFGGFMTTWAFQGGEA